MDPSGGGGGEARLTDAIAGGGASMLIGGCCAEGGGACATGAAAALDCDAALGGAEALGGAAGGVPASVRDPLTSDSSASIRASKSFSVRMSSSRAALSSSRRCSIEGLESATWECARPGANADAAAQTNAAINPCLVIMASALGRPAYRISCREKLYLTENWKRVSSAERRSLSVRCPQMTSAPIRKFGVGV